MATTEYFDWNLDCRVVLRWACKSSEESAQKTRVHDAEAVQGYMINDHAAIFWNGQDQLLEL